MTTKENPMSKVDRLIVQFAQEQFPSHIVHLVKRDDVAKFKSQLHSALLEDAPKKHQNEFEDEWDFGYNCAIKEFIEYIRKVCE